MKSLTPGRWQRIIIYALFIVLTGIACFVLYAGRNQHPVSLLPGEPVAVNEGWYSYTPEGTIVEQSLPTHIESESDGKYRLYRYYPSVNYDRYISIYTHHQKLRVLVDGTLLYSYEPKIEPDWLMTYRAFYHIVVIPKDTSGELCLETVPLIKSSAGEYSQILAGESSSILNHILKDRWYKLVVGLLLFFVGIVYAGIGIPFSIYSKSISSSQILGFLVFTTGLWQLEESRALQLIIGSQPLHWCLEYVLPLFIPFLVFSFLKSIVGEKYKIPMLILFIIDIVGITIQVVLQLAAVVPFTDSVTITYILYVITFLFSAILINRELGFISKKVNAVFLISMILGLILFILHSFGIVRSSAADASLMFGLTLIFFSLSVAVYQRTIARFEELKMTEMYRKLAMIDIATGAGSRSAWYNFVDTYPEDNLRTEEACLILFDMNNLKQINDTFGHQVGDKVLVSFYDCLRRAFNSDGKIYRIGGDEFICLCTKSSRQKIDRMLLVFDSYVEEQSTVAHAFSVAYGSSFFVPHSKSDFKLAQAEADKRMYECKQAMKSKRI